MPVVTHIKHHSGLSVVRVDRGTDWGNPFVMRHEGERDRVCDLFSQYAIWRLSVDPTWLLFLRGKNLACWCSPKRCHAETLLELANADLDHWSRRRRVTMTERQAQELLRRLNRVKLAKASMGLQSLIDDCRMLVHAVVNNRYPSEDKEPS